MAKTASIRLGICLCLWIIGQTGQTGQTGRTGRTGRTKLTLLTFKLDIPGSLCRAGFAILAMLFLAIEMHFANFRKQYVDEKAWMTNFIFLPCHMSHGIAEKRVEMMRK